MMAVCLMRAPDVHNYYRAACVCKSAHRFYYMWDIRHCDDDATTLVRRNYAASTHIKSADVFKDRYIHIT